MITRDIASEVQTSIDQGVIPRDEHSHEHILAIVRAVVQRRLDDEPVGTLNLNPLPARNVNGTMHDIPPETATASRYQHLAVVANSPLPANDVYMGHIDNAPMILEDQMSQLDIVTLTPDSINWEMFHNEDIGGQSASSTPDTLRTELLNSPSHEFNQYFRTLGTAYNDEVSPQALSIDGHGNDFHEAFGDYLNMDAFPADDQQQIDVSENGNSSSTNDYVEATPTYDLNRDMEIEFETMLQREIERLDPIRPFANEDRNLGLVLR